MTVEVVEKKKGTVTCGDCGAKMSADATVCPKCGSKNIKKSLVIVRKAVGDLDDDLESAVVEDSVDDEAEDEDEEVEDEVDESDEDEDDDDDEDEEDEEDEEEDEEVEDEAPVTVGKAAKKLIPLEALNLSTAFAEDVIKVFTGKGTKKDYEATMVEFNNVMDAAADNWFSGKSVSKAKATKGHAALIRERVNNICKEEKIMAKPTRPKALDSLELPDDVKSYITTLEGGEVEKSHDPYKDLPEEVVKSLKAADKIVEEREQEKWSAVAKGYAHFPGDKVELAKTLRTLSESAPDAFEELKKSLDAAEFNLSQSDIFKSHGLPGGGETTTEVSKRRKDAAELVEKGEYKTIEQAEVALMDGTAYVATNK